MRIGMAQVVSGDDPWRNLELVADAVAWADREGVRLLVLPEATMCCFGVPLRGVAEPTNGEWASRVREIAGAAGITVVVGMFTPADDKVRNTLLVVGGGVDTSYDKIHLFDAFGFQESRTVEAGLQPVTFTLHGAGPGGGPVTVGLATCYDVRFPGLFQQLADRGAEVVVVPASWGSGPGKAEQWQLLVRARALDATAYVVGCGQGDPTTVGREPGTAPTGVGHSLAASPTGAVLGSLGAAPGRLVVDVEPAVVAETRAALPVLANRRF